ncbi:metal ABC transporter substrate-binding protein [Candidatus Neptunichlamydia sp. REUL1]|uniref:metal ABC transporter substrate-binding protein n=1 Tax=Candidatus Neptunichlamydia sp. REUL1 TaxID=3064277 RepID=UPI00292F53B3|nr:zinc ABC transporter substrate-binding protein [Candidatus Neptunochlamydia sp. REUL1]
MIKKFLSIFLLIVFLASCQKNSPHTSGKPFVVTSIPPYVSLVQAIVGDTMTVASALGENFCPHATEITPNQMKKVQNANLFIGVGEAYESKLIRAMNQGDKKTPVLELDKKISLLSFSQDTNVVNACHDVNLHLKDSRDLHIWLGPQALIPQVSSMVEALSKLNPDSASQYNENGNVLIKKIKEIDQNLQEELRPFQKKAIIVSHPALGYFCHEYNLTQITVECEGKEPLARDATNILRLAKNSDVICAFTAPQFNNKGTELIAQKLNIRIESFNPLALDPLETIQQIANAITK